VSCALDADTQQWHRRLLWQNDMSKYLPRRLCVDTSRLIPPENLFSTLQQSTPSAQPGGLALIVPHSWCLLALDTVVTDHPGVLSDILALNFQSRLGLLRF
jgi:hypothetical protein